MNKQKGVALVQVLLITSMLLILIIEISKDSKKQVNIATLLKNKASLEMQILSERERLKFLLLTANKSQSKGVDTPLNLNFRSQDVALSGVITARLQDEDGLVSLPYGGESLLKLLNNDETAFKRLQDYQGGESALLIAKDDRGGLLPAKEEAVLAGIIKDKTVLEAVTHLPTFQFNLYNSPEALLEKVYGKEKMQQIVEVQRKGNLDNSSWREIIGGNEEFAVSKLPGNFITMTLSAKSSKQNLTRTTRIMMDFDQTPFIAEVAVN